MYFLLYAWTGIRHNAGKLSAKATSCGLNLKLLVIKLSLGTQQSVPLIEVNGKSIGWSGLNFVDSCN